MMGRGKYLSSELNEEAIKAEIELMEKEILRLTGRKRARSRQKYLQLLRLSGKYCLLHEPVYFDRK
jgi:hypothetical protein